MSGETFSHFTPDGSKPWALAKAGNSLREALKGWPSKVLPARSAGFLMGPSLRTMIELGFRSYWMATASNCAVGLARLNSIMVDRSAEATS